MVEIVTDAGGRRLGSIRTEGGKLVARDRDGARLAFYEPTSNSTRSMDGQKIGEGNTLKRVLTR